MTDRLEIPVVGGNLAAFRLGSRDPQAPVVLAIHGITSSSRSWLAAADAVGDGICLVAVDLRGRARSNQLGQPYGLEAHVRDMLAVLDHLGLERAVVAGHSLGAYIAASLAQAHPDRIRSLVLVDGGLTIPGSQDVDPEEFMAAFLGPTLARLKMSFPDREAYGAWWREHPAFAGSDADPAHLNEYADFDLVGQPPELHSSVDPEVVRVDGTDLFTVTDAHALSVPAVLLCAPRGMVDDDNPMQPLGLVQGWAAGDPDRRRAIQVPNCNHYTILLGRHGAEAVAGELITATAAPAAAPVRPS